MKFRTKSEVFITKSHLSAISGVEERKYQTDWNSRTPKFSYTKSHSLTIINLKTIYNLKLMKITFKYEASLFRI
jgi:hypothetical protein